MSLVYCLSIGRTAWINILDFDWKYFVLFFKKWFRHTMIEHYWIESHYYYFRITIAGISDAYYVCNKHFNEKIQHIIMLLSSNQMGHELPKAAHLVPCLSLLSESLLFGSNVPFILRKLSSEWGFFSFHSKFKQQIREFNGTTTTTTNRLHSQSLHKRC